MGVTDLLCRNCETSLDHLASEEGAFALPSSASPSLHTSNDALSDVQISCVKHVLEASVSEIAELDIKISRLRGALTKLESSRKIRADLVENHRALLSPVRRVSDEIWAYIFQIAADDRLASHGHHSFDFQGAPMLLTRVCRSWRRIAIRTPYIWSIIRLQVESFPSQKQLILLQTFLSRSCALPLTVDITIAKDLYYGRLPVRDNVDQKKVDLIRQMYSALCLHSHRWVEAILRIPTHHLRRSISDLNLSDYPILRRLLFEDRKDSDWCPGLLLDSSPILQHLSLELAIEWSLWEETANWSTLKSADLNTLLIGSTFIVLRWAKNLKRLSAHVHEADQKLDDDINFQDVQHLSLEELAIQLHDDAAYRALSKIFVPSLRHFRLEDSESQTLDTTHLQEFLERTKNLSKVEIEAKSFNFLRSKDVLPSVESLHLRAPTEFETSAEEDAIFGALDEMASSDGDSDAHLAALKCLHLSISALGWRHREFLRLHNALVSICRQVSPSSRPRRMPSLATVLLEATVRRDSYEFHMLSGMKDLGLDCLEVNNIY